jgi:hypothetical protein
VTTALTFTSAQEPAGSYLLSTYCSRSEVDGKSAEWCERHVITLRHSPLPEDAQRELLLAKLPPVRAGYERGPVGITHDAGSKECTLFCEDREVPCGR